MCGNSLYVNPARYARGGGRCCSPHCSGRAKRGLKMYRKTKTAAEHFWGNIKKTELCWLWRGTIDNNGYGKFQVTLRRLFSRVISAHRFSYEIHIGKIPNGLCLDHICRVRNCVNPAHLEAVSHRENVLRGEGHSAKNARKTHCKNGHEFTYENTRIKKNARNCIECARSYDRMRYNKHKS